MLSTYFEENKQSYAAPEYRKIAYVKLVPENIADESAITDEQVKEDYDKNIARFTTPETRTIEQLVFPEQGRGAERRWIRSRPARPSIRS